MNKYQEALSELERAKETLYPLVTMYDSTGLSDEAAMTLNDIIPTFEELVDRATPKKTELKHFRMYNNSKGVKDVCPNCKQPLYCEYDYCGYCGQALDWTNESEQIAKGETK